MRSQTFYSADLAYIHDAGFGEYARRAAPEIAQLLGPRDGEHDRDLDATKRTGRRIKRKVVEFGCGSGTVAERLSEAGYDVLGVDVSAAMVRMARKRAPRARFRVGSWATARIPTCDAIVAIGEVICYATETATNARHEKQLRRFFSRASRALRPGGLLIVDFMASARGRTFEGRRFSGKDWTLEMTSTADRSRRLLTRPITIQRMVAGRTRQSHETHRVRIYSRGDVARMLRAAGFRVTIGRSIGRVRLFKSDLVAIARKSARLASS